LPTSEQHSAEVIRETELSAIASEESGIPSASWSFLKLLRAELDQDVYGFCVSLLGVKGLHYPSYEMRQPQSMDERRGENTDVRYAYLFAQALSIAGGTSEVQRTIIADRILRLPREPNHDRKTPWRQLRRS
jgi:alkylation response protein AidB-like acyl-CoA dehydrogenase